MKYRPIFTKLKFLPQLFVDNYKDLHEIPINNLVACSRSQIDRLTKKERKAKPMDRIRRSSYKEILLRRFFCQKVCIFFSGSFYNITF